jgi:hypothetical protein
MRKHPGVVSRCQLSFDRLEVRALLSGGNPGMPNHAPAFMSPPPSPIFSEPPSVGSAVPEGGQRHQGSWAQSPDGSMPWQPAVSTEPQPPTSTQPQPTGRTQPLPDFENPSVPAGTASDQTVVGPSAPSGFLSQSRTGLVPGVANLSSFGLAPGSIAIATPLARGPSEAANTEPAGTVDVDAPGSGATVSASKEFADEVGGNSLSMSATASSPPAQPFSLLAADHGGSTHLLSSGDVSPAANSLTPRGASQSSSNKGNWSSPAHRTMVGMIGINGRVAGSDDRSLGEWPDPSAVDLIVGALPIDRAALNRAIDQFFHQMEELNASDFVGQKPAHIVFYALALASTFAALDAVSRRWRQAKAGNFSRVRHHSLTTADPGGFPELPGSWSSRLS